LFEIFIKMKHTSIIELLSGTKVLQEVVVKGWVRTFRSNRFIALNDGSTIETLQCVIDFEKFDEQILKRVTTGAAISVKGTLVESQGAGQKYEVQVTELEVLGDCDVDKYPIQLKNRPSLELLRENAHLRIRTNTFSAVMRVRSALSFAVHSYFQKNGFFHMHSPFITVSDAEGAGETFRVTTLDPKNPHLYTNENVNHGEDFCGNDTNLPVSGQLEGETYAMGLGKIYTFGPTFRAENSNTSRHLAEFWMIEPEMAFHDLHDNMDLAEDFIKDIINYVLEHCQEDLAFLQQRLL